MVYILIVYILISLFSETFYLLFQGLPLKSCLYLKKWKRWLKNDYKITWLKEAWCFMQILLYFQRNKAVTCNIFWKKLLFLLCLFLLPELTSFSTFGYSVFMANNKCTNSICAKKKSDILSANSRYTCAVSQASQLAPYTSRGWHRQDEDAEQQGFP